MIDYGQDAGNQMALTGLSSKGEDLMNQARAWVNENKDAWAWFMEQARKDSAGGRASSKRLTEGMRLIFKREISNSFTPCFARIAKEEDPSLKFVCKRSKVDGFTSAKL